MTLSLKRGTETGGTVQDLTGDLPRSTRGYDCSATEALLGRVAAQHDALERECRSLRDHAAALEAELAGHRRRERLVSAMFQSALNRAAEIKDDARRDAELALRKAREKEARCVAAARRLEEDREGAERELARLGKLAQEIQTDLSGFLTKALEQLRADVGANPAESRARRHVHEALVDALDVAASRERDEFEPGHRPASPKPSV